MKKLEADGLCTALVSSPKDAPEKFAFIMEHTEMDLRLYFFVTRDNIIEILDSLIGMMGHDA